MAADRYKYFRIEAHEIVDALGQGLLALEKHADAQGIASLLRLAHTLKGAARIVKHRELADLSHALEDVLAPLRDAPVAQRADRAFELVDQMTVQLAALAAPPEPASAAATAAEVAVPEVAIAPMPRLDGGAIDDALATLSSLHARVARLRAADDPREVMRQLEQLERAVAEARQDVESLRMTPAGTLFTALERTARDAALASGRLVGFMGSGHDVRVEAPVLHALYGPLVQLVRNAVVHGIEPPAQRATAEKAPEGRVMIAVRSLGRRIAVSCEDDGRGLDLEAIRRAARERGIVTEARDAPALFELLLRGGITTSPEVTELAGRGIGLDVVREATQRLGGEVRVETRAGGGTTITMTVPVSIAADFVLGVRAGGRSAAIPQSAVRRVARLRREDLVQRSEGTWLAHDGEVVPCVPLAWLLDGDDGEPGTAVFVDGGGGVAAIGVERVLGIEETIVRPVPRLAPTLPIVAALALDAEGAPYPILEPRALVAAARTARGPTRAATAKRAPILVVDDSLTTRMLEQSVLESAGYEVEVAASAEEALEKLVRTTYALVLADVEMPGMDGFGLVAELRARPELARVPAILVTSRAAPEDLRRGIAVGAQGYMVKGKFDQIELLAMIRRLLAS